MVFPFYFCELNCTLSYGIYRENGVKFIYISKVTLSEHERQKKISYLYRRTKNVIVVQYDAEITEFIKERAVISK